MSRFVLCKTFRTLLYHRKLYLSVLLQVAVGIAVIYASAAVESSVRAQFETLRQDARSRAWNIAIVLEKPADRPPLDFEQYTLLKQELPGARLPFFVVQRVFFARSGDGGVDTAYLLFASDDYLYAALGADRPAFESGATAYVGEDVERILQQQYRQIMPDVALSLDEDGRLSVDGRSPLAIEPATRLAGREAAVELPETSQTTVSVPLAKTAWLPLSYYFEKFSQKDVGQFRLSVLFASPSAEGDVAPAIARVLHRLTVSTGNFYSFTVEPALQAVLLRLEHARLAALNAAAIAVLCFVVVAIGLSALAHLLFARRLGGLAIASAVGASKKTLFAELLLEATLPSLAGGLIGTAIGAACLHVVRFEAFELRQSPALMAAAVLLSVVPGAMAAGSLAIRVRWLKPLEILRKE